MRAYSTLFATTAKLITLLALCGVLARQTPAADFSCVIQPRQVLEIRSPIEGLIERIVVERGDRVQKGQEIAFIDTSVERVLAESAKFRSGMEGSVRAAESKVQLFSRKLIRADELLRQNFASAQLRDEALNDKQLAEAEAQEARDNRKLAEFEHRRQLAIMRLKTIRSPIDGVVTERILNPGELAEAGVGRKPILKLAQTNILYVEALLPADVYRQIKAGLEADVRPEIHDAGSHRATVAIVDRVLDAASDTFGVRLELPNPRGELLAGVRCKVSFASVKVPAPSRPANSDPRSGRAGSKAPPPR